MITGHNANIRHGDRVFHVQTEDSGRAHPHVTTLLYFEGTILASERSDYTAIADAPDLAAQVRQLMESQHAAVVERLRRGEFDAVIEARLSGPATAPAEPAAPRRAAPRPRPGGAPARPVDEARAFGEGIVSERPLDDVILEYLIAKSRERSRGGRGSRSEG
jgi:hypothetical protein